MNQRIRWGAAYLLGWTSVAVVTGSHAVLTYAATGDFTSRTIGAVATLSFAYWYSWAPAGLIAIRGARRFSLIRHGWLRSLGLHLLLAFLLAGLVLLCFRVVRSWAGLPPRLPFAEEYLFRLGTALLTYGGIVAAVWIVDARSAAQKAERRAAELSADLTRVRLEALRARLAPHFLFNTLNSIQSLVGTDPDAAEEMLGELGGLLRGITDEPAEADVSLSRELRLVEAYLRIQKVRLEERLRVSFVVGEGLADARVPPLILQPVVENAVEHAVAVRREGGSIEIEAHRMGDALRLRVTDDGPGLEPDPESHRSEGGMGLSATAERLTTRYGDRASMQVEERETGGVRVTLTFPLQPGEPSGMARP